MTKAQPTPKREGRKLKDNNLRSLAGEIDRRYGAGYGDKEEPEEPPKKS